LVLPLTLRVDFIIIFILELYLDKVYYKKAEQSAAQSGGGFGYYYYFPGFKVPNYLNLFTKYYPECKLDAKSIFIFNCFSEYHVKLLEQSIISHLKPEINDINTSESIKGTILSRPRWCV
jgi:hypothetical protein